MLKIEEMIGKKIKNVKVDGFEVEIIFEDNTAFYYSASDGGYSCWSYETIIE